MGCFGPPNLGEFRIVYANQQIPSGESGVSFAEKHKYYADNVVVTSKYKIWNFIPKNLFEQFRRVANFYFLCVVIVQFCILDRSPVSPATSLLPLAFVIVVTAIKQGYEDWLRHKTDAEVNNRPAIVVRNGQEKEVHSKDIAVGDIVKVDNHDEIPCDLVVISTTNDEGECYIMTANLDGETNLKMRSSLTKTVGMTTPQQLADLQARVECDHPNYDMYKYNGRMIIDSVTHALGPSNLLLRGAKLKNTDYAYGLAVYTGKETKMAQNQKEATTKFSSVEKKMNSFLILFLLVLVFLASILTGIKFHWDDNDGQSWYLPKPYEIDFVEVLVTFLSFLILFNYIIPISLYVTVEVQKFCGSLFFNWDLELYHELTDEPAKANTSDLNEELGQIEYVFSDKTGTLTENDMQFRQCSIGGVKFMEIDDKLIKDAAGIEPGIDAGSLTEELKQFFLALSLCHTVQADEVPEDNEQIAGDEVDGIKNKDSPRSEPQTKVYQYQASSPDEKALCEAAARYGVIFKGKSGEYMELEVSGKLERYKILHVLEFDSTRKRMSIILETPGNEILMLCKGAESHVTPRCTTGPTQETLDHIDGYAELGLRTLTIVSRKIPRSLYKDIDTRLVAGQQSINDREEQLAKLFDEIETDFHLLGATAVEDKLQDGVKETIESLREAGIKVWVLTGDKLETAVNISHSCGHFKHGMQIMYITGKKTQEEVSNTIDQCLVTLAQKVEGSTEYAVVVDGSTLAILMENEKDRFVQIGQQCVAVLCCRMSPLQKAQVVQLVKHSKSAPITLAIGDGANDCSMIQEAHVGCGIMGKEGRQAVRCSDYAFHRFRYLKRVLLVHGHYYYSRLAVVIQYFFYKNVAFMFPQVLYQFVNGYSAQSLYSSIFLTCYNIFFTSIPVILYGIFEKDLKPETLMEHPSLYKEMTRNRMLSWKQFAYWMIAGSWHGIFMYIGVSYLFQDKSSFDSSMADYGLFSFGTFIFTLVVIVTNLKFALFIHFWTWFTHLFLWGSIILYFILVIVLCALEWPWEFLRDWFDMKLDLDLYNVIFILLGSSAFWFALVLIVWVSLLPDIALTVLKKHFQPSGIQLCQVKERPAPRPISLLRVRRELNYCQMTESQEHRQQLEQNLLEPSLYYR